MEITEVVERVLSGDTQAYAKIVGRFQGPLFAYLGRMGLTQAQAEELAQETFLRAWTHLRDFNPRRGAFTTWIYTIAHRLALSELGRAARRQEIGMTANYDRACDQPQPPEAFAATQSQRLLRAALLELPARERSAIALAYVGGISLADVARIEGCSVGAIKTRLHRARRRLAERLQDDVE